MRGRYWSAIAGLCLACGGHAASLETSSGASGGASAERGGSDSTNSAGASAGGVNAGGLGGASTPPLPNYVPDQAVPYDKAYFEDGSFEENGFGWDTCHTRTPAVVTLRESAPEGMLSLEFSSAACEYCKEDNPSASEAYLWFKQQPSSGLSLYFDVLNLSNSPPLGELRLETSNSQCMTLRPLLTIALSSLALQPTWQTRCVDLPAFGADYALGVAVTGAAFDVALDAFRLGPPCHAR
ncbi:MAG: hypothetical protein ABI488_10320 [Polyangiaceae bacterium]